MIQPQSWLLEKRFHCSIPEVLEGLRAGVGSESRQGTKHDGALLMEGGIHRGTNLRRGHCLMHGCASYGLNLASFLGGRWPCP